jgi:hypothetical protein
MKSLRVLIIVLTLSAAAFAGEPEFQGIVHSIEATYGVHHVPLPLVGVALFFARPAGAHGLRLAIFEGFKVPTDSDDFRHVIESSLGPGWYPFVRVRSKGDTNGETTLIYANPNGGNMRMMIVNVESSEAQVIEMNLRDRDIKKWLKEPGEEADNQPGLHHQSD